MAHAVRDVADTRRSNRKRNLISYQAATRLEPLFYVTPATLLFCLLMLYPMVMVIRYSLMSGAIVKKTAEFAGLQNYQKVFIDPVFWESVGNTLYFTVMSVIFHLLLGLAFALLLNSPRVNPVLRSVLRVLFILPWLFTAVIIAIIWRLLLDPNGVINSVLVTLHIVGFKVEWFSSPATALHAVTFVNIWAGYPLYMVSLLAGLQGIPKELYEAADIDGANAWQRLRFVILPALATTTAFVTVIALIQLLTSVDHVIVLTRGGPDNASTLLLYRLYEVGFQFWDTGYAAAMRHTGTRWPTLRPIRGFTSSSATRACRSDTSSAARRSRPGGPTWPRPSAPSPPRAAQASSSASSSGAGLIGAALPPWPAARPARRRHPGLRSAAPAPARCGGAARGGRCRARRPG